MYEKGISHHNLLISTLSFNPPEVVFPALSEGPEGGIYPIFVAAFPRRCGVCQNEEISEPAAVIPLRGQIRFCRLKFVSLPNQKFISKSSHTILFR